MRKRRLQQEADNEEEWLELEARGEDRSEEEEAIYRILRMQRAWAKNEKRRLEEHALWTGSYKAFNRPHPDWWENPGGGRGGMGGRPRANPNTYSYKIEVARQVERARRGITVCFHCPRDKREDAKDRAASTAEELEFVKPTDIEVADALQALDDLIARQKAKIALEKAKKAAAAALGEVFLWNFSPEVRYVNPRAHRSGNTDFGEGECTECGKPVEFRV